MSIEQDGGPAFPIATRNNGSHPGMSLRDWFAGQALTGLLSDPTNEIQEEESHGQYYAISAVSAYMIADAMLAARKEPRK